MRIKRVVFLHFKPSTTIGIASEIFRLALCRSSLLTEVIVPVVVGWPILIKKSIYPTVIYSELSASLLSNRNDWRLQCARFGEILVQLLELVWARLLHTNKTDKDQPKGQDGLYSNSTVLYDKIEGFSDLARIRRVARSIRDFGKVDLKTKKLNQLQLELIELGIKPGEWYACLHVRTSNFHKDDASFRNAKFDSYYAAIEHIISLGGKVVRMGDSGSGIVRFPQLGLIDYPNTRLKSELMDLFLIKNCRFFIGTLSGILDTAYLFGRPTLCVNSLNFDARSPNPKDRILYKQIFCRDSNKKLTFANAMDEFEKIMASDWASRYYFVENTSEEIFLATKEFIKSLANNERPTLRQVLAKRVLIRKRLKLAIRDESLFSMLSASIAFSRCQICDFYLQDDVND
jgi:putative glycosyltransferase (TIGR04372 family)